MGVHSGLAAIGFGLAASLSWGTSDFSGGLATKRTHVFSVMVIAYGIGLLLLVALALIRSEPMASLADLAWAAAAGLSGAAGLAAYYRALAVGRMGITAPVAAVLGTMIPVVFGAAAEGLPGTPRLAGFGLALTGVWFLSRPSETGERSRGLGLAMCAGLGFGLFFILIDQVSEKAVFWPLVSARGASFVVMLAGALASRQGWHPQRSVIPAIVVAGLLDVGGNTFFLLSSQAGRLDVASVLSSLYPAVTAFLAWLILKEHLTRAQMIGMVAAVIAIPLIAS